MRTIAIISAFNEERFIANCLTHLVSQGVDIYLLDNGSTDRTLEIAEQFRGRGLIEIEPLPRFGLFDMTRILDRKEELASDLDGDWFIHMDADEVRLPPRSDMTLGEAIQDADRAGYNAINFQEYTFVPTREAPNHDHDRYQETMRWYYPFEPFHPHRLNAWKRQSGRVDLKSTAGHNVRFPGLKMAPQSFPMRHYIALSLDHAIQKYGQRRHPAAALKTGWHGWREQLDARRICLLSETELRRFDGDDRLDPSSPLDHHPFIKLAEQPT
jgi:glycosyltransferase involved in cell wall biosynthesis